MAELLFAGSEEDARQVPQRKSRLAALVSRARTEPLGNPLDPTLAVHAGKRACPAGDQLVLAKQFVLMIDSNGGETHRSCLQP
jgi:hypothetical protein